MLSNAKHAKHMMSTELIRIMTAVSQKDMPRSRSSQMHSVANGSGIGAETRT